MQFEKVGGDLDICPNDATVYDTRIPCRTPLADGVPVNDPVVTPKCYALWEIVVRYCEEFSIIVGIKAHESP